MEGKKTNSSPLMEHQREPLCVIYWGKENLQPNIFIIIAYSGVVIATVVTLIKLSESKGYKKRTLKSLLLLLSSWSHFSTLKRWNLTLAN